MRSVNFVDKLSALELHLALMIVRSPARRDKYRSPLPALLELITQLTNFWSRNCDDSDEFYAAFNEFVNILTAEKALTRAFVCLDHFRQRQRI